MGPPSQAGTMGVTTTLMGFGARRGGMLSPMVASSIVEPNPSPFPFVTPPAAMPVRLCHLKDDPPASLGIAQAWRHVTGDRNDQ